MKRRKPEDLGRDYREFVCCSGESKCESTLIWRFLKSFYLKNFGVPWVMEQEGILVFKLLTSQSAGKSTSKATVTVGQCVRTACARAVC